MPALKHLDDLVCHQQQHDQPDKHKDITHRRPSLETGQILTCPAQAVNAKLKSVHAGDSPLRAAQTEALEQAKEAEAASCDAQAHDEKNETLRPIRR